MPRRGALSAVALSGVAGVLSARARPADAATADVDVPTGVVDVKDYGAAGDGTTVDNSAITSAVAAAPAGAELLFPPGVYAIDSPLTFSKSLTLRGIGATIKKVGSALAGNFLSVNANHFRIQDLAFEDPDGLVSNTFLHVISGHSRCRVERCEFNTPAAVTMSFTDHTDGGIDSNRISATRQGILLLGHCSQVGVSGNDIGDWTELGIGLNGTASGSASDTIIDGNTIHDLASGGGSRYPIHTSKGASTTDLYRIRVSRNTVIGPGKSWTAADPGTADQISLSHCDQFQVVDNVSLYGGDMGITVGDGSTHGVVSGNVSGHADSAGIALWTGISAIAVVGNVFLNNGQNRNGDRSAITCAGIRARSCSGIAVAGNTLGDDQTTKTQDYGVSMTDCDNVVLGPDTDVGNALALYFKDGSGNVDIEKVSTVAF